MDAIIVTDDRPNFSILPCKFPTDADGRFRLPAARPDSNNADNHRRRLSASVAQNQPRTRLPSQDFRMRRENRFVCKDRRRQQQAGARCSVSIKGWKGSQSLESTQNPNHPKLPDTKIPKRADVNGVWEWTSAPDDPVKLSVGMKGASADVEIAGGAPERTVVLKSEHRITGRVTDAATGQPIPAFTVIPIDVFRKDWQIAERGNAKIGKDGRLNYLASRTDIPLRLRIEGAWLPDTDGTRISRRRRQVSNTGPPARTEAADLRWGSRPRWQSAAIGGGFPGDADGIGRLPRAPGFGNHKASHRRGGRFRFPDPGEPFAVVARVRCRVRAGRIPNWPPRCWIVAATSMGVGPRPVPRRWQAGRCATILLYPIGIDNLDRPRINAMKQSLTGPDGRFEFARVPPGPTAIRVHLGPWRTKASAPDRACRWICNLGSGSNWSLATRAIVSGKVKLTGKVPADLDCTFSLNYLIRREPGIAPPPDVAALGFDARARLAGRLAYVRGRRRVS